MKSSYAIRVSVLVTAVALTAVLCGAAGAAGEEPRDPSAGELVVALPEGADVSAVPNRERLDAALREGPGLTSPSVEPVRVRAPGDPERQPVLSRSEALFEGAGSADAIVQRLREAGRNAGADLDAAATRVPVDEDSLRDALREAGAEHLTAEVMRNVREAGMARLMADRETFRSPQLRSTADIAGGVSAALPGLAQRTPLLPLPSAPAPMGPTRQERAIVRLTAAIAAAESPDEVDRLRLRLAAAYVGSYRWDEAQAIYEDLEKNATRPAVRQTARRNLRIISDGGSSKGRNAARSPGDGAGARSGERGVVR